MLLILIALSALATALGHGAVGKPTDDWFAIDFGLVANQKPVVHDGATYSCVKLVLRPEDGGKSASTWEVMARVQHPMTLPASYRRRSGKKAETACAAAGGTFVRLDKLESFVNAATGDDASPACNATDAAAAEAKAPSESPLARAIAQWNDRFFNMDTAVVRRERAYITLRSSFAGRL